VEVPGVYDGGLVFRPDGRSLLAFAAGSVYQVSTIGEGEPVSVRKELVSRVGREVLREGIFSRDGRYLATPIGQLTWIWDTETWGIAGEVPNLSKILAFGPPSETQLATSVGGRIEFWDWKTRRYVGTLYDIGGEPHSAAFSPDGGLIATGGTIKAWDWSLAQDARCIEHVGPSAPEPSGHHIAVERHDLNDRIDILNVDSGERRALFELASPLQWKPKRVLDIAYSPDGKRIAVATLGLNEDSGQGESELILLDVATGDRCIVARVDQPVNLITTLAFSRDGRRLAAVDADGVTVWTIPLGQEARRSLAGGSLSSWRLPVVRPRARIPGVAGPASEIATRSIAWMSGEKLVHYSSLDRPRLTVWDTGRKRKLPDRFPDLAGGGCLAVSPDDRFLAITTWDEEMGQGVRMLDEWSGRVGIRILDGRSGRVVKDIEGLPWVLCLAFSPEKDPRLSRLAAGFWDEIKVWDTIFWEECLKLRSGAGHRADRLEFDRRGRRLFSQEIGPTPDVSDLGGHSASAITIWETARGPEP
jgi:WD40 repeat protein